MEEVGVVYRRKERVTIEGYDGKDYIVRDLDTKQLYNIDETYFRRHYESSSNDE